MEKKNWKDMVKTIEKFKQGNDWSGCLKYFNAEMAIPEDFQRRYILLNEIGFIYSKASQYDDTHNQFIRLADTALRMSIELPGNTQRVRALKSLAYIYYNEFQGYTQLLKTITPVFSKGVCEREAITLYEKILQQERDVKSLYRYAHMLALSVSAFRTGQNMKARYATCKKSLNLYEEAMKVYEEMADSEIKKACRKTYIKACYNASKICVILIDTESKFVEGYWLTGGYEARRSMENFQASWHNVEEDYLIKAGKYINIVRKEEKLPIDITDMHAISMQDQNGEMSWDIYYQMGKIWECAYKKCLLGTGIMDFTKAEKYYRYSCDIDFVRKKTGKRASAFPYMYAALMQLYQVTANRDSFDRVLVEYKGCFRINSFDAEVYQVKWKMIEHQYEEAKQKLKHIKDSRKLRDIQEYQVEMLMDMIEIIQGQNINVLKGKYSANQVRILLGVQRYVKSQQSDEGEMLTGQSKNKR